MAEVSNSVLTQIEFDGTTYDLQDAQAQQDISNLSSAISEFYTTLPAQYINGWEQGYIRNADGTSGTDPACCRTQNMINIGKGVATFTVTAGYKFSCYEYSTNSVSSYVGRNFHEYTGQFSYNFTNNHYYKFSIRKTDDANFEPSDIPTNVIGFTLRVNTDKTLSIPDFAADAKATGDIINSIQNDVDALSNRFIYLYDPKEHTFVVGEGYNANTGVFGGTDQASVTFPEYFELSDSLQIVIKNNSTDRYIDENLTVSRVLYYRADKSFIDSEILLPQGTATIPSQTKYIRFAYTIVSGTMTTALVDTFGTAVINTVNDIQEYTQSSIKKNIPSVFYVGANRTGNNCFTTLKAATEYIWENGIYDSTVYVDRGIYDLEDEFGSEWLESWVKPQYNPTASGLKVGNRTHFIFEHGAKILFNYSGENTDIATAFSPINIAGSCIFDNMQIEAQNCRYCVHEDYYTINTSYEPYQVEYNNCEMLYHAKTLEGGTNGEPIGAGCMPGSVSIINGGCFINEVNQADISYHNYAVSTFGAGTSMVVIKNAYMAHWCGFGSFGDSVVYGYVSGCRMKMEAQNGYVNNVIRQWGNTIEST